MRLNSLVKTLIKTGIVVGLLVYLAQEGLLSVEATKEALFQENYIIPAFLALLTTTLLAAHRWHVLLRAQAFDLTANRTVQLQFVGNFFNIALPGVVSGDVIKAIYVGREVTGQRAHALSSILFDRVAGVSGLVLVSLIAFIISLGSDWSSLVTPAISSFVVGLGSCIILFYIYLFFVPNDKDLLLILFRRLEKRWKFIGAIKRTYEGILRYRSNRKIVSYALMLSMVIHCLVIFACVQFTSALEPAGLPTLGLYIVIPLGLLVTAIPMTPAGMGTGHVAFTFLFNTLGSQRGADVFTLFILYQLFQGALGGLVYMRFKSHYAPALSSAKESAPST